jgi:hypothetical protein
MYDTTLFICCIIEVDSDDGPNVMSVLYAFELRGDNLQSPEVFLFAQATAALPANNRVNEILRIIV